MPTIPVKIAEIKQSTPTIKTLRLDLMGRRFTFHSGQWIDLYANIDGERQVAGYTLASSPNTRDHVEISVKTGDNPVTRFIHEQARAGDTLYIEGGQGTTYYTRAMGDRLVLVAAGIGVTPIISILRYAHEAGDVHATLLYSAATSDELLYLDEIEAIQRRNPLITAHAFVTREKTRRRNRRIDEAALRDLAHDPAALHYVSGPRDMITDTVATLKRLGITEHSIKYEHWR